MRPLLLLSTVFLLTDTGFIDSFFGSQTDSSLDENDWLYPEPDYDDEIVHRVVNFDILGNGTKVYNLLAVTDMDKDSKGGTNWTWRAVTRKGTLMISKDRKHVTVTWCPGSDRNLTTHFNVKGRAMELSDLSEFNGRLLSPDDKTGLLYEIKDNKAIPWLFLNSGPGNTTQGMKAEWTTIKGNYLYVGGHGTEYRDKNGNITSEDAMWIKIISKRGEVRSVNWKNVFLRIRKAVNISSPGYLTHEAVQWSPYHRKWFFLPRKESQTIYNEKEDEMKGSNLLIIGDPLLRRFKAVRIGSFTNPERGFSAFELIPATRGQLIVALKSEEVEGKPPASYITVFDIHGNVLLDDEKLQEDYKFEGLYIV